MTLSQDQQQALDAILAWAKAPTADLSLGGYAGTGKTTILKEVTRALPHARVMTPTGRAAQVLRRKGVQCETIHSTVYTYNGTYEDRRGREQISWRDKEEVALPSLWIVDEASMVDASVHADIKQHGVPVLWVGDHGQLPPVGGDPGLMRDPDIRLERIHRQAMDSPILRVAHAAREGNAPTIGVDGPVSVVRQGSLAGMVSAWMAAGVDQVACAFNRTRVALNLHWRVALGRTARIVPGERLICLFNDRSRGVYNGTILTVVEIHGDSEHGWDCTVEDDGGQRRRYDLWSGALNGAEWKSETKPRDHVAVDYAYAITTHKSQGGEWNHFAVVDQPSRSWNHDRWRYTAYSRAAERLSIHV